MTDVVVSEPSARSAGRLRRTVVVVLLVVSMLCLALGSVGVWAARTTFNNAVFTERVGDLGSDPAVQAALATYLTDEVMDALNVEEFLASRLPPAASVLAVPLSGAVDSFVQEQVEKVLATDAFANVWRRAISRAHKAFVFAATSDTPLADTSIADSTGGQIVVNLLPVIALVLQDLTDVSPDLVANVGSTLESLVNDPPAEAIATLQQATGVTLPEGFGVITIEDDGTLGTVRDIISFSEKAVVGLIVLFVVTAAGAVALSQRRERTLAQFLAAAAVVLAVVRQAALVLERELVDMVQVPVNRDAADAIATSLMQGLFELLGWLLLFVIIGAVAMWVVNRRHPVSEMVTTRRVPAGNWWRVAPPASHHIAAVVVAVAALWWLPASLWLVVLVVVALVLFEVVLARSGRDTPTGTDSGDRAADAQPDVAPASVG
jgi:hypothetical protein